MNMRNFACLLFFYLIIAESVIGQTQNAITESGKKVLLNIDGTWKYQDTINKAQINSDSLDCNTWIETNIDKVDGKITTASKNAIVMTTEDGKYGLSVFLMKGSTGTLILAIKAIGASVCVEEGAKINILFADESRLVLNNNSKFNCKSNSVVYFGGVFGKKSELDQLKIKPIKTMRVWTADSYVEMDFSTINQNAFMNVINCLSK